MRDVFLIIAAGCAALLLESLLISLVNWLLKPRGIRQITLIPIEGGCDDIEHSLRWQLFKHEAELFSDNIMLIVDCGISAEGAEIARRLCRNRNNCRLCKASELKNIVGDNAVCKGVELVLY